MSIIHVSSGQTSNGFVLEDDEMFIHNGGTVNRTTLNGGHLEVMPGGKANSTTVRSDGWMVVSSGGTANDVTVGKGGVLNVEGGTALNVYWCPCIGSVDVADGGILTLAGNYRGVYIGEEDELLSSAMTMTGKTLADGRSMCVIGGGRADSTTLKSADLKVFSGGTAAYAVADDWSRFTVYSGGTASRTTARETDLVVHAGGVVNGTVLNNSACLTVYRSGIASNTNVNKGGSLILSGGTHAGRLTIADGAVVSVCNGGVLAFDISKLSPDAAAHVNDLSRITGSYNRTLNVTASQAKGTYILAGGASDFKGSITIYADQEKLSSIGVNGIVRTSNNNQFTLMKTDDKLILLVAGGGPEAPKVTASTTEPTNKNVTITATFSADSVKKEYSKDQNSWRDYTQPITVKTNSTYYFRAINSDNKTSRVVTFEVTNIDKTAPEAPKVTASTTELTNKSVTVTANFSGDSVKKQYSTDNDTWKAYTAALTVTSNGTYYFRGIDAVGNVSKVTEYTVSNITTSAPKIRASTTKPPNKSVTLTADYNKNTAQKQYSTDGMRWKNYTKPIKVKVNGTYYFRGIDAAGNISDVGSITVENIDKTAPEAPVVSLSSTKPTNKSVTIKVQFSNDSAIKQYSTNKKNWLNCSDALTVSTNGTYYFRSIDAAGNISWARNIKVKNIDKVAPKAPTPKLTSTKITDKSVTIKGNFSKDSSTKQFSVDNKGWRSCGKTLTVNANGTYYFRGIDEAGNISGTAKITVTNIADTSNNSWAEATKLKGTIFGALDRKIDPVDYYNVGDVTRLMLDMEKGKAKITFCDKNRQAVAAKVRCSDGKDRVVESLTLVTGTDTDQIALSAIGEVRYLMIESMTNGSANYRLDKLA